MDEKYGMPERKQTLLERISELEQYRIDAAEVIEKMFARLKRAEDRLDNVFGSEPRERDDEILRPARETRPAR